MLHSIKTKEIIVDLDKLNWEDVSFRISSQKELSNLIDSIRSVGLLNPPYVLKKNNDYSIVSGFRRLKACQLLNKNHIPLKEIDSRTPLEVCAQIAIIDNSTQRQLNLIEQSRCYVLLDSVCDTNESFDVSLSSTGLSNNPGWIAKIKPLCNLPLPIQEGIEKEAIPLVMASILAEMEEKTAVFLGELFIQLSLGLNKQREIIQTATDIAKRDDLTLWELLHQKPLTDIIENKEADKNSKASKIRQWLKEQRYPQLSKKQDEFQEIVKTLKLGDKIKLSPPAYFEGKNYKLTFDFSKSEDISDFIDTLGRIEKNSPLLYFLQK